MKNLALAVVYAVVLTTGAGLISLWLYGDPWKVGIGFVFGVVTVEKFVQFRDRDRINALIKAFRADFR